MKCKDCVYLTGRKSSVGVECMEPENQKKWAQQEAIKKEAGRSLRALLNQSNRQKRYKQPSTRACKRFKSKPLDDVDCGWL